MSREWEILKWIAIVGLAAALALVLSAQTIGAPLPEPTAPAFVYVISPWDGTFYAGDYPGATPHVVVGSVVKPNTVVGTIDASMNPLPLRAMVEGTVVEVLVSDGQMVAAGESLIKIQLAPQPVIGR